LTSYGTTGLLDEAVARVKGLREEEYDCLDVAGLC